MSIRLSKTSVNSYVGDVLPIKLLADTDITKADIKWSAGNDCLHIRSFTDQDHYTFDDERFGLNDGVLLTLNKAGESIVCAEYNGEKYECKVQIRERMHASSDDDLNYYIGDLHVHAEGTHNFQEFAKLTDSYPQEFLDYIKEENMIDFTITSDHSDVTNKKAFFNSFVAIENAGIENTVIFAGTESEASVMEKDAFNNTNKNSGEIVTFNADSYSSAWSWNEFFSDLSSSPHAICILAHPQPGSGRGDNGIWSFALHKNNTPEFKNLIRYIETGNGGDRNYNCINEYIYSVALDNGFRVSTTCSGDRHGAPWGYAGLPGKTIIMAPEKSKEAFLDALLNLRAYACDSGNVKLRVEVNGSAAPCDLALTNKYSFHVKTSYFRDDPSTVPVTCQVISDYGRTIKVIENVDFTDFSFEIESDSARYFYLRLLDSEGRRTWSPPIFTGREYDECTYPKLTRLFFDDISAYDEVSGDDVSVLFNRNPKMPWYSEYPTASIIIDMKKEREICSMGHLPHRFKKDFIDERGLSVPDTLTKFVHKYRISTSLDGINYTEQTEGIIRVFGGEEMLTFPLHTARYIKFEVLATIGKVYGLKKYEDSTVSIGELSIFTK